MRWKNSCNSFKQLLHVKDGHHISLTQASAKLFLLHLCLEWWVAEGHTAACTDVRMWTNFPQSDQFTCKQTWQHVTCCRYDNKCEMMPDLKPPFVCNSKTPGQMGAAYDKTVHLSDTTKCTCGSKLCYKTAGPLPHVSGQYIFIGSFCEHSRCLCFYVTKHVFIYSGNASFIWFDI